MYLLMENDPSIEFEFYLAQKLGKTVDQLRTEMSAEEFTGWSVYYGRLAQKNEIAMAKKK